MAGAGTVRDIKVAKIDGSEATIGELAGDKPVLVTNVASKCGFTPHYVGLQTIHDGGKATVIGQPCNQFGKQEPGSNEEILAFASKYVGKKPEEVFPLLAKADVKGSEQSPLFAALVKDSGVEPSWNFCKYLYTKDGKFVKSYGARDTPEAIMADIEKLG